MSAQTADADLRARTQGHTAILVTGDQPLYFYAESDAGQLAIVDAYTGRTATIAERHLREDARCAAYDLETVDRDDVAVPHALEVDG